MQATAPTTTGTATPARTGGRPKRPWHPTAVEVDLVAAVRAGVIATLVLCLGFASVILHTPVFSSEQRAGLLAIAAIAVAGSWVVSLLATAAADHPHRAGWLLALWSTVDIVFIGLVLSISGGWQSPFIWFLILPVVYFTTLLDSRTSGVLFALAAATPVITDSLAGASRGVLDRALLLLTVLAVSGIIAGYLSRELRRALAEARTAQRDAERRTQLLDATGTASRGLMGLDSQVVMDNLLQATVGLGFGTAWLALTDAEPGEDSVPLRVVAQIGLDLEVGTHVPRGIGISHTAVTTGATIVVSDHLLRTDTHPAAVAAGIRTAAAVPITIDGTTVGVLGAGSQRPGGLRNEEREALETLAVHAGLALRNAQAFEREADAHRERELEAERRHDYLATASHELRTPLTVVHGASTLLHERWEDLPEDKRRLLAERTARHSADLVLLVERLHQLDELHRGTQNIVLRPFVVADLVQAVAESIDHTSRTHLVTRYVPTEIRALADANLLSHTLRELLRNVLTHTPPGTHVHISVASTEDEVEVILADDGPGIPADELATITETFRRTGEVHTRTSRGIGIGFTLVERILALHGTSLELESGSGGTVARFRLPAVEGSRDTEDSIIRLDALTTSQQRREFAANARSS